jgi:general stress protein 26
MSAQETMKQIVDTHNLLHLATIDSKGLPCLRGVDYAAGDEMNILYFMTRKDSRKVADILGNPQLAVTIDKDCPSWEDLAQLKYFKATGIAAIIEDPQEMEKAMGLLIQKFPFFANLPGNPADFVGIRITLGNVLVTDNTIEFGHIAELNF